MRSQLNTLARFYILIYFLVIGACVHKTNTFSAQITHNDERVYLEQTVFSKGAARYKMGHPYSKDHHQTFEFSFELDAISSIYYAYLSIESWDVEGMAHPGLRSRQHVD